MKKLSNKRKKNLIKIYFTTLAIFMACAIGLIGCGMLFTEAMDEDDKEKASEFVSDLSSELKSFFEYEPEKELSQEADADEDDSTEGSDTAKANDPAEAQKATDADNSAKESGTTGSSSPFGGGILKSTADINLHSADGGKKNYVFTYNGTDFSAEIRRTAAGRWEISVTEPYPLEGLTMTLCGGETRLTMSGLEAPADVGEGAVSAAKAIAAAYDAAVKSSGSFTATDDGYKVSGTCPLGAFTAELGGDGAPLAFSCDTAKLSAALSGFEKIPETEPEAEIIE